MSNNLSWGMFHCYIQSNVIVFLTVAAVYITMSLHKLILHVTLTSSILRTSFYGPQTVNRMLHKTFLLTMLVTFPYGTEGTLVRTCTLVIGKVWSEFSVMQVLIFCLWQCHMGLMLCIIRHSAYSYFFNIIFRIKKITLLITSLYFGGNVDNISLKAREILRTNCVPMDSIKKEM